MIYSPSLRVYQFRHDCESTGYHVVETVQILSSVLYSVDKDDLHIASFGLDDGKIIFVLSGLDKIDARRHLEARYHQNQVSVMARARRLI